MGDLSRKYISGLDGLRAIAVIMVIGYHLKIPYFKGGVLGVTIFFVISGFLITRLLLRELQVTNSINLKAFWLKRIRRIWPALLFMASLTVIFSAIFNRVLFTKASNDFISVIFGFNNWYQIFNNISYFDNGGAASPLLHCWSLAIETQFYLFFPFVLLMISKMCKNELKRKRLLIFVTSILTIISAILMYLLFDPSGDPSRVYYGADTRAFSLLIGALLAIIVHYNTKLSLKAFFNNIIGMGSLFIICIISANVAGYDELLYKGGYLFVSILASLVILSILKYQSILSRILALPIIDWLGKLSYSIYLWHYPIIILMSGGKKSSIFIMFIEIISTIVMSIISYYLIETPIRHGRVSEIIKAIKTKKINMKGSLKRDISVLTLSLILFVSSILCVAFVPKESMSKKVQQTVIKTDDTKDNAKNTNEGNNVTKKTDEDIINDLDILIIGDSVAEGAQNQLLSTFPNGKVNAKVSRHCSDSIPVLQSAMNDTGWDGDCLIFSLGTNGPMYDFMAKTREILKSDKAMFILTIRAPYEEWTDDNNVKIREFCENTDNVYLIDWADYSEGHNDWFVSDETHLTTAGTVGFANCIKEKVLEVLKKKK